jgi:DNA-directed RNA polymerase specialized sigma24 family protein
MNEPVPYHRILREIYRHYSEFRDYVSSTGKHVIEYSQPIYDEEGHIERKIDVTISFWDLHEGLKDLAPRKKEAMFYNVILDWKQKDVAEKMGITTVSVGQYVEQACRSLAQRYFAELEEETDVEK